jgi:hypothetical protein
MHDIELTEEQRMIRDMARGVGPPPKAAPAPPPPPPAACPGLGEGRLDR